MTLRQCFENLPGLSDSDSTCQREVMGRNLSPRQEEFWGFVIGHTVPEGTGRSSITSLQAALNSSVDINLVTEER